MPFIAKVVVSLVIVAIATGVAFLDPMANNAGPDSMWRGGRNDSLRNLVMQKNGMLRRATKPIALAFFGFALILIWVLVPTK